MDNAEIYDLKSIEKRYSELRPSFERLVKEVMFAINGELNANKILNTTVTSRVKSFSSLRYKLIRKKYNDPFAEIFDFAGIRIVCRYSQEIDRIKLLLLDLFEFIEEVDKTTDLGTESMGYHGLHVVVRLGNRYSGTRYNGLQDLVFEVQIRTVLQDAWALISHQLAYKSDLSIPMRLKRNLNNVSSLLEIAQYIFDDMHDRQQQYVEEIKNRLDSPRFLEQPIDSETLTAYTKWKFPDLEVNQVIQELLLADLDHDYFKTLRDIDMSVNAASNAVFAYSRENPNWFKYGTDYITKSLGFTNEAFRAKHNFGKKTREAFLRHMDKVNQTDIHS